MMRFLPLLVLVGLAVAKPGPDTAIKLEKAPPYFNVTIDSNDVCPPTFDLKLRKIFPSTGWSVVVDSVKKEQPGHIVIRVSIQRPRGMAGAAMTAVDAHARLGILRRGPHLVEIRARTDGGDHKRVQALVLNGKGPRER